MRLVAMIISTFLIKKIEAGHLQECNKQLFEELLRRVIVGAKERVQKAKAQPGGDTTGERPVLDTQISSESITIGAPLQQVTCPILITLKVLEWCLFLSSQYVFVCHYFCTRWVWYFDLSPYIVHLIESPDENVNINEPKIELNKLEEINI